MTISSDHFGNWKLKIENCADQVQSENWKSKNWKLKIENRESKIEKWKSRIAYVKELQIKELYNVIWAFRRSPNASNFSIYSLKKVKTLSNEKAQKLTFRNSRSGMNALNIFTCTTSSQVLPQILRQNFYFSDFSRTFFLFGLLWFHLFTIFRHSKLRFNSETEK
jgi:hypothetical protein